MRNRNGSSRRGRIAAWVAVTAVAVTAFASLGGVGLAQSAIGLHQYQYGKKVTICHKGKGSIRISLRAWLTHKRHGDVVGTCFAWKQAHGEHMKKKHAKAWQKQDVKRWKKADRQHRSGGDPGSSDTKSSQQGATFTVVSSGSGRDGKSADLGGNENGHGKGNGKGKGNGNGEGGSKH